MNRRRYFKTLLTLAIISFSFLGHQAQAELIVVKTSVIGTGAEFFDPETGQIRGDYQPEAEAYSRAATQARVRLAALCARYEGQPSGRVCVTNWKSSLNEQGTWREYTANIQAKQLCDADLSKVSPLRAFMAEKAGDQAFSDCFE